MTYKFNILGIKISFDGHLPGWLVIAAMIGCFAINVVVISAIAFWAIETLFKYHIDYTIETVLAVAGLKFFLFNAND